MSVEDLSARSVAYSPTGPVSAVLGFLAGAVAGDWAAAWGWADTECRGQWAAAWVMVVRDESVRAAVVVGRAAVAWVAGDNLDGELWDGFADWAIERMRGSVAGMAPYGEWEVSDRIDVVSVDAEAVTFFTGKPDIARSPEPTIPMVTALVRRTDEGWRFTRFS